MQIHLVDVDGLEAIDELLLNVWGMRDNTLTASDSYAPGNRRTFTVTDWDQAQTQPGLAGTMRRELDDPDFVLIDLPIFFGE